MKNRILNIFFIVLIFINLFLIGKYFWNILDNIENEFGYLDFVSNWRVLEDFLNFKIPYKDYFHSYGVFFMFLQSFPYLILGRNFLSLLISRHIYFPLLGIIISFLVAKNILREKIYIFLFLIFCLFFGTNYDFTSVRHLMAELSLSFFILGFFQKNKKFIFLGGIIGGLALITSLEYGIALNASIFIIFFLYILGKILFSAEKNENNLWLFKKFWQGELLVLVPILLWWGAKGALRNYWDFTFGFINNFYYNSPCAGDSFPRLGEINIKDSKLIILGLPIEFLKRVNLYLGIIFLLLMGLVTFVSVIKKKNFSDKEIFLKFSLIIYGLFISLRTLDTPCLGYFTYSLVPIFLLLVVFIKDLLESIKNQKSIFRKIWGFLLFLLIFGWIALTGVNFNLPELVFGEKGKISKEAIDRTFYPPLGWKIKNDLIGEYQEVVEYIERNTQPDDFLYVYPWGPYNFLTKRKFPTSVNNLAQIQITEGKFMELTKKELAEKKPKLVIINIYNNLGVATFGNSRGDVPRYFSLSNEEGPVFAGEGNIIEKFILENYETVFANKVAIVMKQRERPITIKLGREKVFTWEPSKEEKIETKLMIAKDKTNYKIKGKNASWKLILDKPIKAMDVEIEFKIDGDFLTRRLSRYFIKIYALGENEELLGETKILARKIWQKEKIYLSKTELIKSIKIEIGENTGLIWWLHPYNLAIKRVIFYE